MPKRFNARLYLGAGRVGLKRFEAVARKDLGASHQISHHHYVNNYGRNIRRYRGMILIGYYIT